MTSDARCRAGDELSFLRQFIEEQQKWLHSVLDTLGWTQERLLHGQPHLMQCPYNHRHFIAKTSLDKHRLKCRYGVVGVVSDELEGDERSSALVSISPSILEAVKKYAAISSESSLPSAAAVQESQRRRDVVIDQSDVVVESHDTVSSLESSVATPQDVLAQGPLHIIRYIKAWTCVPADFLQVSSSKLNPVEVKAWLFTNLPEKHKFSAQLGGEIQAVEVVMKALTSRPSLTPDSTVTLLTPLLDQQCRSFVLSLWKFLHTVALQRQHTVLDSEVQELTPLPPSALSFLRGSSGGTAETEGEIRDTLAQKIQGMAAEARGPPPSPLPPLPPLPPDHLPYSLSTLERRILYDYVVEVGGTVSGSHSMDPSLFRDDAAAVKAKLKQQARKESEKSVAEREGARETNLYQMKRDRDYRRRRQKYRARNVHITRRTPAQVMRDIINARMLELSGGPTPLVADDHKSSLKNEEDDGEIEQKFEGGKSESGDESKKIRTNEHSSRGGESSRAEEASRPRSRLERRDSQSSHRHGESSRKREKRQRSRSRERRSERSRSLQRSRSGERKSSRKRLKSSPARDSHRKDSRHAKSEHERRHKREEKLSSGGGSRDDDGEGDRDKHRHHHHSSGKGRKRDREKSREHSGKT